MLKKRKQELAKIIINIDNEEFMRELIHKR